FIIKLTATTITYTLSLHDALPIFDPGQARHRMREQALQEAGIGRLRMDHVAHACLEVLASGVDAPEHDPVAEHEIEVDLVGRDLDRKSTRLNSSHVAISYAVFCLK